MGNENQPAPAPAAAPAPAPASGAPAPAGNAPATPAVPVQGQQPTPPQAGAVSGDQPKPAVAPAEAASPKPAEAPESSLLSDLPPEEKPVPIKPTLEALKVPEKDNPFSKDDLLEIVAASTSQEEAQRLLDLSIKTSGKNIERLKAQNKQWIASLKDDPEFGGAKWEESKALYAKGVVARFGKEFAEDLRKAYLDGNPAIFKDVVRQQRALLPKPLVQGAPPVAEEKPVTIEQIATKTYGYMTKGNSAPAVKGMS